MRERDSGSFSHTYLAVPNAKSKLNVGILSEEQRGVASEGEEEEEGKEEEFSRTADVKTSKRETKNNNNKLDDYKEITGREETTVMIVGAG